MNIGPVTVDFDSTVITREGTGSKERPWAIIKIVVGVIRITLLLAFVSETKMVANAWLRPGNTAASSNCEAFKDETFEHSLGGQQAGLVRADSGFLQREDFKLSGST